MYTVQSTGALARAGRLAARGRLSDRIGRTVLLLGACSLLTDISSEMVATVLPLYLVATLGFTPLQYGVVDGLYQGAGSLVRLAGGFLGDRFHRHKTVAALGYGVSAVCKLLLAVIGAGWGAISSVILLDRTGKGVRTSPRDAMISLSAPPRELGLAFGVHRAMDTAGAMIGPLAAFALLSAAPGSFRTLFLLSFLVAVLGVGVLVLLVREPEAPRAAAEAPVDVREALALLRDPRFRALGTAACALSLATASDAFVYLVMRNTLDFSVALFPLLATGTALAYMSLAVPAGRLADRWGRGKVFLAGYALLLAAYAMLLLPAAGAAGLVAVLLLLGAYYAATDGVLMALGSAHVPEGLRGSGLSLLGTATSVSRLFASLLFGALWTAFGARAAVAVFACGLLAAMAVTARSFRVGRR